MKNKKNDDDISAAPARRVSFALRATLGYAVLATIWILGIHELIEQLDLPQLGLSPLQIDAGAGLLFVAVTAALLYVAIKRAERRAGDARIGFEPRAQPYAPPRETSSRFSLRPRSPCSPLAMRGFVTTRNTCAT